MRVDFPWWDYISYKKRRRPQHTFSLSHMRKHIKKPWGMESVCTLILDFVAHINMRNKFLLI
jgi:hypothetical protein